MAPAAWMTFENFDKFLASAGPKYILIAVGVVTIFVSLFVISKDGIDIAVSSLSSLGLSITVFSILIFLYHHDSNVKDYVSTLSTSSDIS